MRRCDPWQRPLDRILLALREWCLDAYRAHPERLGLWSSFCPACHSFDRRTLAVREPHRGAAVSLWCRRGCSEGAILAALYPEPAPPPIADPLVVGQLAVEVLDLRQRAAERVGR
jgi:hypothetical protein